MFSFSHGTENYEEHEKYPTDSPRSEGGLGAGMHSPPYTLKRCQFISALRLNRSTNLSNFSSSSFFVVLLQTHYSR